ncbi:hypothetical protein OU5_2527 [Pseudomonas mandelii JR-1]|uniref:Uncharacterized protein n=1 Tax=Pseudomonas mandelii JR-1 TaxID=1147786 RepID=A0A024EAF4_9PSED|nr:hypothetical protein OU5_2527 [Pseudomonas mandelii JR-1]
MTHCIRAPSCKLQAASLSAYSYSEILLIKPHSILESSRVSLIQSSARGSVM